MLFDKTVAKVIKLFVAIDVVLKFQSAPAEEFTGLFKDNRPATNAILNILLPDDGNNFTALIDRCDRIVAKKAMYFGVGIQFKHSGVIGWQQFAEQ